MNDPKVYGRLTDLLLDGVHEAVDKAGQLVEKAQKREEVFDRTGAMLLYQAAHQNMLNAVVSSNVAVVTSLDEIRALLKGGTDG